LYADNLNSELSQEIPSSDPVDLGEGDDWDTVGGPTERSRSPAPTVEKLVSQMTQRTTRVVEPPVQAVESRPEPSATTGAEEQLKLKKRRSRKPGSSISPAYLALRP
jgi:hypothetical protein